jgi:hypothetical protein
MSPSTFVLVMCILLTFGCLTTITNNFKAGWVSKNQRFCNFFIALGLAIWGWLIYF